MSSPNAVLDILRTDGRASTEDIARQTNTDPETVEEIIGELEDTGVIRGYRAVIDRDKLDDQPV
ncbi:Lrp/AsnC family transcriptional regulator, partial [Halobacteriales archaeon QH_10_65_19]